MAQKLIKSLSVILFIATCISLSAAHSAEWVSVSGKIELKDGTPLCAMVLANGQHMFTCSPMGEYNLNVPLDDNEQITLFAFCEGLMPFKKVLDKWQTVYNVQMTQPESPDCKDKVGSLLYGLAIDNYGNWTVVEGRFYEQTETFIEETDYGWKNTRVPVYTWWYVPTLMSDTDTLGDDENIFCSESEAWEEANRKNQQGK